MSWDLISVNTGFPRQTISRRNWILRSLRNWCRMYSKFQKLLWCRLSLIVLEKRLVIHNFDGDFLIEISVSLLIMFRNKNKTYTTKTLKRHLVVKDRIICFRFNFCTVGKSPSITLRLHFLVSDVLLVWRETQDQTVTDQNSGVGMMTKTHSQRNRYFVSVIKVRTPSECLDKIPVSHLTSSADLPYSIDFCHTYLRKCTVRELRRFLFSYQFIGTYVP